MAEASLSKLTFIFLLFKVSVVFFVFVNFKIHQRNDATVMLFLSFCLFDVFNSGNALSVAHLSKTC